MPERWELRAYHTKDDPFCGFDHDVRYDLNRLSRVKLSRVFR